MPRERTRGDEVVDWIEEFCRVPSGPDKGRPVRLKPVDIIAIRQIYDDDAGPQNHHAAGELAAYLALLHTCGIEAPEKGPQPQLHVDPWTIWSAADNPVLRNVLKREADAVICPALGTRFPNQAA